MVIDTSAILAVLENEAEASTFKLEIASAAVRLMSAGTYLETAMVVESRKGADGIGELRLLLGSAGIRLVPFDAEQAMTAQQAFSRYGKGRHRAALNFGDCFSYALAKSTGEPLLFKGNDFSETDIPLAFNS
ncbi:MAG: type II toxin-antitoxin system VapC family toxin [Trueperaceae bacterium]